MNIFELAYLKDIELFDHVYSEDLHVEGMIIKTDCAENVKIEVLTTEGNIVRDCKPFSFVKRVLKKEEIIQTIESFYVKDGIFLFKLGITDEELREIEQKAFAETGLNPFNHSLKDLRNMIVFDIIGDCASKDSRYSFFRYYSIPTTGILFNKETYNLAICIANYQGIYEDLKDLENISERVEKLISKIYLFAKRLDLVKKNMIMDISSDSNLNYYDNHCTVEEMKKKYSTLTIV